MNEQTVAHPDNGTFMTQHRDEMNREAWRLPGPGMGALPVKSTWSFSAFLHSFGHYSQIFIRGHVS